MGWYYTRLHLFGEKKGLPKIKLKGISLHKWRFRTWLNNNSCKLCSRGILHRPVWFVILLEKRHISKLKLYNNKYHLSRSSFLWNLKNKSTYSSPCCLHTQRHSGMDCSCTRQCLEFARDGQAMWEERRQMKSQMQRNPSAKFLYNLITTRNRSHWHLWKNNITIIISQETFLAVLSLEAWHTRATVTSMYISTLPTVLAWAILTLVDIWEYEEKQWL